MFVEVVAKSGSNGIVGTLFGAYSGSTVTQLGNYQDWGDVTGFNIAMLINGANLALSGSALTNGWTVKTIIRSI